MINIEVNGMKKSISFLFLLFLFFTAHADHITGGEMYYSLTGSSGGLNHYHGTLKLLKSCFSNRQFNDPSIISVFNKATLNRVNDISVPISRTETLQLTNANPCITNPPAVCYDVAYFEFDISLPGTPDGYIISSQVTFRINGIVNMSDGYSNVGATYTAEIPGSAAVSTGPANKSAKFIGSDLVVVCAGNNFNYSFAASDDDGDRLQYSFSEAYDGGTGGGGGSRPAASPPYYSVPYSTQYDGSAPLGNLVKVDAATGLITGIAPPVAGTYVVTVRVDEIRNNQVIASQRKDIQINIAPCTIAGAVLQKEYMLCESTTNINLVNLSNSPLIRSQNWELFNASGNVIYTSSNISINYNFADTGLYTIKLAINRGQACADSTISVARVYPGFNTGFFSRGVCLKNPTTFRDASTTVYGRVNSWNWNFGEGLQQASASPNVSIAYSFAGTKNVRLIVGNSVGCIDTAYKDITIIDKPPIALAFRDTLVCTNDLLQLKATGSGNFSWSPSLNMINSGTASPEVRPASSTTYYIDLDDDGCVNRDSVKVRVTDHVSLQVMKDTVICQGDAVLLNIISDGFKYSWTPAAQLSDPIKKTPLATTGSTTTYEVTAAIGGCSAKGQVLVSTVPYPLASAGKDTIICNGGEAHLHGLTNGSSFNWSPAVVVNNAEILNPVARPLNTTTFVFSAFDTKGCPKPARDSVVVAVLPDIQPFAGRDTSVITGQPLQLQASGGVRYLWTPATGLSNINTSDPVLLLSQPSTGMTYKLMVYNEAGCVDSANMQVKVFNTKPSVFVPTAFSPNGDGRNDLLRPIAVGMKQIHFFQVFNRWGQLVFSTVESNRGWDGTISGRLQDPGMFIWMVKATDYAGGAYFRKGTVMLVR
jgi:gliding motility-associated-like protein